MFKGKRKHQALIILLILSSLGVIGVFSNGATPTIDPAPGKGIWNFDWFNASVGVNAPDYFWDGMNYSAWIESKGGGVTDHGFLTGLGDDDHPQYLLDSEDTGNYTTVRKNAGVDVGTRTRLNFEEGANITLTVTDDPTNDEIDIVISATGGGLGPAGPPGMTTISPFDYVIYYNSTSGTYNAQNGYTGSIDFSYSDPTSTIESVWSALSGGGSFKTTGGGETWTVSTTIDGQNDNVTWESDMGLIFKASSTLDDNMIYLSYDHNIKLIGLNLDHDHDNQDAGSAIRVYESDNVLISYCKITDARYFGIQYQFSDRGLIEHVTVNGAGRNNGITFGAGCTNCKAFDVYITRCGDTGATAYNADNIVFEDIISENNQNQLGTGVGDGKAAGFTCEESTNVKYIRCIGRFNSQCGFMSNNPLDKSNRVDIIDSDFHDNDQWGIQFWSNCFSHKIIGGRVYNNSYGDIQINECDDALIQSVDITSLTGQVCIDVNTASHLRVINNKFSTDDVGLDINNGGVVHAMVDQNDFNDCATDVSDDNATSVHYGGNLNQNGTWVEGSEP